MFEIYYHPLSFPSLAPIFTASAIGADYQIELIDLGAGQQSSPEYLAINPSGRVPALQDGDFTMSESAAIMRYIARKLGSDLYPQDVQAQAKINQWIDFINHHLRAPIGRIHFNRSIAPMVGAEVDMASAALGEKFLASSLPIIDAALSKSPFLCGDKMSLADIALIAALEPIDMSKIDISASETLTSWRNARRSEELYTNVHSHYAAELGL